MTTYGAKRKKARNQSELILQKVSVGVAALEKVFLSGQLFASSVIVLF